MTTEDEFRMLVSAYYGVREMDEHDLRIHILSDIENYIKEFVKINPINNFDYRKEAYEIENSIPFKQQLQDSLLVLPKVKASLEFILLVKERIRKLNEEQE